MKYIKNFESYSTNEGVFGKTKKFFTGHEDKDEKERKKSEILKSLDEIEKLVSENPKKYVFNRKNLEKLAKEDKYRGEFKKRRGGRDSNKIFITYQEGKTGFDKLVSGSGSAVSG
jgi:hypothetical protein